jgi:hypothetical protein
MILICMAWTKIMPVYDLDGATFILHDAWFILYGTVHKIIWMARDFPHICMPPSHAAALYTPPPMATEASGMPIQKIACKEGGAPNDPRCNCTSPETNQTTQLGWHITVSAYAENTLCLHARVCVYSSPGPFRPSPCPPQPDLLTHVLTSHWPHAHPKRYWSDPTRLPSLSLWSGPAHHCCFDLVHLPSSPPIHPYVWPLLPSSRAHPTNAVIRIWLEVEDDRNGWASSRNDIRKSGEWLKKSQKWLMKSQECLMKSKKWLSTLSNDWHYSKMTEWKIQNDCWNHKIIEHFSTWQTKSQMTEHCSKMTDEKNHKMTDEIRKWQSIYSKMV